MDAPKQGVNGPVESVGRPLDKKVLFASGVALLVIVMATISLQKSPSTQVSGDSVVAKNPETIALDADPDNDSLKNWEEDLWATDKNNADTDGDGTPDGTEVRTGHNPLKQGPNDKIQKGDFGAATKNEGEYFYDDDKSLTTTDVISRDLFTSYVILKQQGRASGESLAAISDAIEKKVNDRTPPFIKRYTETDFQTTDNSVVALKNYGNEVAQISQKFKGKDGELSEATIMHEALTGGNLGRLKELATSAEGHGAMLLALSRVHVPQSILKNHTLLMNNIDLMRQALIRISEFEKDPLPNMKGFAVFSEGVVGSGQALVAIGQTLSEAGIAYKEGETGFYLFPQYPTKTDAPLEP